MKTRNMKAIVVTLIFVCLAVQRLQAATHLVSISSFFFNPTNITINVGDTVQWTNTAAPTTTHDTTSTNAAFPWGSTNYLSVAGRTYSVTFTNAGTFSYMCATHVLAFMPAQRHPEQTGTVFVASANLPPSVSLTNPANNARFRAPTNLLLQASAADSDGSVTNVQFFSGASPLGNVSAQPFQFTASNLAAGNYAFTARASDNKGSVTTSAVVNVFVLTNAILSSPVRLANGQFKFTLQGISGQTYAAEHSTNLQNWSAFVTNVAPANSFNVTDTTSTNVLLRFYRARQDL
ncbi:MAG: hypothetical protein HOP33_06595 [Verrucomicrobia bacterium]|nr:hypothetical protein [Verrucomicrobiota bacterium]